MTAETAAYIVAGVVLGAGLIVGLARGVVQARDVMRRQLERLAYQGRRQAERRRKEDAEVEQLVRRYFPFAREDFAAGMNTEGNPAERLTRILSVVPGVQLGTSSIGFPAVLPQSERRKHVLTLGKSGFGKTTIALRMVQDDLGEGRGLCVLGSEAELFRDWILPLVPASRAGQVIYFKPADPRCPLTWNPLVVEDGEDRALAAGELFAIFKRAIGEDSIGARADAILSSAFAILVGRRGASLWSLLRLLEDNEYRTAVLAEVDDPYLRDFWTKTFPEYPSGAVLPIANRLNQFLRLPQIRSALCHPISSFSVRDALAHDRILLLDISGFDPSATTLLGQCLISKWQLELMRREKIPEQDRKAVHAYVDEFHVFAGASEASWRELLSRGRRYGLGLHLFTQHPNQLPRSLQHEIFGNVSSVIALNLSGADAAAVRRELLIPMAGGVVKPIPAEDLVSLPVGEGFARLGSGACALKVKFAAPIEKPDVRLGDRVREISWKAYAAPPLPSLPEPVPVVAASRATPLTSDTTSDDPVGNPQSPSTSAPGPPTPGRGGAQHKLLQKLAREWGEERGFRASIEESILGGAGRVDVGLVRPDGRIAHADVRIAVEVAVTSTPEQIAATVTKCFTAGFTSVVVLSSNTGLLEKAREYVRERIGAKDRDRVQFLDPDGFRAFLDCLGPDRTGNGTAGYQIAVEYDRVSRAGLESRRRTLARLVGGALLRKGWPS